MHFEVNFTSATGASPQLAQLFRTQPGPHKFGTAFSQAFNKRAAPASTSGVPSALNRADTPDFRVDAWTEIHENCATRQKLDKCSSVTDMVPFA
jgi:hypothetical protein